MQEILDNIENIIHNLPTVVPTQTMQQQRINFGQQEQRMTKARFFPRYNFNESDFERKIIHYYEL